MSNDKSFQFVPQTVLVTSPKGYQMTLTFPFPLTEEFSTEHLTEAMADVEKVLDAKGFKPVVFRRSGGGNYNNANNQPMIVLDYNAGLIRVFTPWNQEWQKDGPKYNAWKELRTAMQKAHQGLQWSLVMVKDGQMEEGPNLVPISWDTNVMPPKTHWVFRLAEPNAVDEVTASELFKDFQVIEHGGDEIDWAQVQTWFKTQMKASSANYSDDEFDAFKTFVYNLHARPTKSQVVACYPLWISSANEIPF